MLEGHPSISLLILTLCNFQLGIGLLVLQQLSGINAVLFYASSIFKAAGMFLRRSEFNVIWNFCFGR